MKSVATRHGILHVCQDYGELAMFAAEQFVWLAAVSVSERGRMAVALSGGSTPGLMYARLAEDGWRDRVAWDKIHFFVGDERCVARDHPDSNFGAAERQLLVRVGVPVDNLHPVVDAGLNPRGAAAAYEAHLLRFFGLPSGSVPCFDLIFLGMGADGHCASLFPGSAALDEHQRLVVDNYVDKLKALRITFTYRLINQARQIIFLVKGADKSKVLADVLAPGNLRYPAQRVRPARGEVQWFVDCAAAGDVELPAQGPGI
jgi:6-phosphogluconolactonase